MSIVSTVYPDPRESARCRLSPEPRRSLEPWDVVDDRCDPSVLLETRREPLRKAPAKADSLRSGFGFDPVRNPNMFPGARSSDGSLNGFRSEPLESLTLRSFAIGSFSRRSIAYFARRPRRCLRFQWRALSSFRALGGDTSRRPTRRSRAVSRRKITYFSGPEEARRRWRRPVKEFA